jgi:hypothetical protein
MDLVTLIYDVIAAYIKKTRDSNLIHTTLWEDEYDRSQVAERYIKCFANDNRPREQQCQSATRAATSIVSIGRVNQTQSYAGQAPFKEVLEQLNYSMHSKQRMARTKLRRSSTIRRSTRTAQLLNALQATNGPYKPTPAKHSSDK